MKALLTLCAVFSLALSDPLPPVYPSVFTVAFYEVQVTGPTPGETYGTAYYDGDSLLYRQDRWTGQTDIMCSQALNITASSPQTECTHQVSNGNRFIYSTSLNTCCYCCADSNGCGALRPDWLDGAEFLGVFTEDWQNAYAWNQSGNVYYESVADDPYNRIPLGLDRIPFDNFTYQQYTVGVPDDVFTLPTECSLSVTCPGLCELFRNNMTRFA